MIAPGNIVDASAVRVLGAELAAVIGSLQTAQQGLTQIGEKLMEMTRGLDPALLQNREFERLVGAYCRAAGGIHGGFALVVCQQQLKKFGTDGAAALQEACAPAFDPLRARRN